MGRMKTYYWEQLTGEVEKEREEYISYIESLAQKEAEREEYNKFQQQKADISTLGCLSCNRVLRFNSADQFDICDKCDQFNSQDCPLF